MCFLVLKILAMKKQCGCVSDMCYLMYFFYHCQFIIAVLPSPKVIEPPQNLSTAIGSNAKFSCKFEASTDNEIAQLHWEFNGSDLAGCHEFRERINCTITQQSSGINYITSTVEINSVQADNAGQYTCYCSYNTSTLNVDGVQNIQSEHKSATLSIKPGIVTLEYC